MTTINPMQRTARFPTSAGWQMPEPGVLLADAIAFARVAHSGRMDEAGHPAIDHPLRVMAAVRSENAKVVAVLHDTLVATVAVRSDLRALLPERLLMAVTALAQADSGAEEVALTMIMGDPLALEVKLACIADLAHPARMSELDPFTRRRRENEHAAAARLLGTTLPEVLARWNATPSEFPRV